MLAGESGWVCPKDGCPQRIVPRDYGVKLDITHGGKTVQQRGEQMAEGLRGLNE